MRTINFRWLCLILLLIGSEYLFAQSMDSFKDPLNKFRRRTVDSMLSVIKNTKSDSVKFKTFTRLTNDMTMSWREQDSALYFANAALALTKKNHNKKEMGIAMWWLGFLSQQIGKFPEALKYFFSALNYSEEANDIPNIRRENYNIGSIYRLVGNDIEAVKYLSKSIKMGIEEKVTVFDMNYDFDEYYWCYFEAGVSYQRIGNFDEALKCFLGALEISKKAQAFRKEETFRQGEIVYRYIGNVYCDMGNYQEALRYLFMGLERANTPKSPKAIQYYRKTTLTFYYDIAIGTVYYKQAAGLNESESKVKYNESLKYLLEGLPLALARIDRPIILDAYWGLSQAYKGIGDFENSLHYLNLYLPLKDSLFNKDLYTKVSEAKLNWGLEKLKIEEEARQQLLLANEKAIREKLFGEQKLQQEKMLADERVANEKSLAEQKLEQEKKMTAEKNKYDKSIAEEKAKQEKLKAEKLQTNNMLLMGLGLVVITSVFLILYTRQRSQKKRAIEKAEAIHKMAELEMQGLRSQLNPHFMFNSLNALQTLILSEENDKSQSYLAQFSKMLRMLLENADTPFIPIQKEIDFLQLYLGLEEMRVPDLQYSISTDPGLNTEQTLIPNMILQPYVENAIWHGLSHKESNKQVKIRIYRQNGKVNCEVEDNGIGRKKAEELKSLFRKQHKSKGMELLSKRFRLLNEEYGSNIEAIITDMKKNDQDSGTLVTIKIPVMQSA